MAIPFRCECGKRLQAKDELAGRRIRCPDCGRTLKVPAAAPGGAPATTGPARPAAAAARSEADTVELGVVQFPCECGHNLKARRQDAGSRTACPSCGRQVTIPAENGQPEAMETKYRCKSCEHEWKVRVPVRR